MSSRRFLLALLGMAILLVLTLAFSLGVGAVGLNPGTVIEVLYASISSGVCGDTTACSIVWQLRLPRALLAMLIGCGLGAAGAAFQGLFRNPLADPYTVGASSGAALGATLAITLRWSEGAAGLGPVPLAAFVGSLAAVGVVYAIASVGGRTPVIALLLAGAALSTMLSAFVSLLAMLNDRTLHEIFAWLLGSLGGRSWPHLAASAPYLIVGPIAFFFLARPLDALACGEVTAQTLGLPLTRARGVIVALASLITAAAVAAGGTIGFVGLISPHIARLLFGATHRRVLPASTILGGLLLLLADDVARTVVAPVELPVGIITALLGGPFFLYILKTRKQSLGE